MKRVVLKFGGTSMASPYTRRIVSDTIIETKKSCEEVIVVISAMGRMGDPYATDTLLRLFANGLALPNNREQDMIYSCAEIISGAILSNELAHLGIKNILLSGVQAEIETDNQYSDAKILNVRSHRTEEYLHNGYVVLVAGSQGVNSYGDITSLGRGGSDTTACALAYYLKADQLSIYTDVDGIFTGDPRIIDKAKRIPYMSYEQCQSLANFGARVIHPRAVEFARLCPKTTLRILSVFEKGEGSYIGDYSYESTAVSGIRNTPEAAGPYEDNKNMLDYLKSKFISLDSSAKSLASAIFIIGKNARLEKIKNILGPDSKTNTLQLSPDIVAVGLESDLYEAEINKLHDALCLS